MCLCTVCSFHACLRLPFSMCLDAVTEWDGMVPDLIVFALVTKRIGSSQSRNIPAGSGMTPCVQTEWTGSSHSVSFRLRLPPSRASMWVLRHVAVGLLRRPLWSYAAGRLDSSSVSPPALQVAQVRSPMPWAPPPSRRACCGSTSSH